MTENQNELEKIKKDNDLQKLWKTNKVDLQSANIGSTCKGKRSLKTDFFYTPDETMHDNTILDDNVENPVSSNKEERSRFFCHEEIARGGMGMVLRGSQNSLQREVAIKKLLENANDQKHKRDLFISESLVTAYLNHPNIISVYDLDDQDQEICLAMKLIRGVSWADILDDEQNNLEQNLQIFLQVCNAVAFAHSKGVIHCDLKPENVMIGEFGEVTLMDWGIAVCVSELSIIPSAKDIQSPMGTPAYFSPELAKGEGDQINFCTDVYLLGAILCELLTGKAPHHAKSILMSIYSAAHGIIPQFPSNAPQELVEICSKALSKEPQQRHQDIAQLQTEIQNFLQHSKSILLAEEAQNLLDTCEIEDSSVYEKLVESYFGFQQALKLWPGNTKAEDGQKQSCLQHAKIAIKKEDFNLAQTLLEKLDTSEEKSQLKTEINYAKNIKQGSEIAQKLFKFNLFFLVSVLLWQISGPFMPEGTQDVILSQLPLLLRISIVVFFATFYFVFYNNKWGLKTNIQLSIIYEVLGKFLLCIGVFFATFPSNFSVIGIFPSALWILFVNILVPYNWKQALIAKVAILVSLCAIVIIFASSSILPPKNILHTLIAQTIVVCIASVVLHFRKNLAL
ncbi:serine/threonine-protein kinase [Candidatus Uabimicrobium sp. HlEnr_7]|uniref:serine/threonine-protein kinase n=1 Tax=Candidatus Uabimicrobium helgolandensis TaxID=3095367 RepID=UPI003556FEA8